MSTASIATKVHWRLALPAILFMLVSSLDRANVSFAATSMNHDLGFSPSDYGFGAGILFFGFLLGQYPSLALLQRVGMRGWLAATTLLWGVSAAAMALLHTHTQFYVLRIVLGFAEGGLAPGIVFYLSQFATERERARTFTLPMLAIPLSVLVGAPLSGWLLSLGSVAGLANWRWMFLAEAVPALVLGLVAALYFPNTPADARWLTEAERDWLLRNAARPAIARAPNDWAALGSPLVILSGLLWFCLLCGSYGLIFWLPQVLHSLTGLPPLEIGLIGALPWVGVTVGMYANAAHSDRTGERFWHIAAPALLAAVALLAAWQAGAGALGLLALLVAGLGLGAAQGAFWALPTQLLTPAALGVSVVAINIAGSSGGFVMPQMMGVLRERSGGFAAPTALVIGVLGAGAMLVAVLRGYYRAEWAALRRRGAAP